MELKSYLKKIASECGIELEFFKFNNTGRDGVRMTTGHNHTTTHTLEDARIILLFLNGHSDIKQGK